MTEHEDDAAGTARRIALIRKTAADGNPYEVCLTRFAAQVLLAELDGTEADRDQLEAEVERLTRELGEARSELSDRTEWAIGQTIEGTHHYLDGYTERGARHHAQYYPDAFPAFRRVGNWQRATDPQHGQETAQEAAGDDPGGDVGNDARDTPRGREDGAESP